MSKPQVIDLIYGCEGSDEDPHFSVRSPQVPGLIAGAESLKALVADVRSLLIFAGIDVQNVQVRRHIEMVVRVEDIELVVRRAEDHHAKERLEVGQRVLRVPDDPRQRRDLLEAPRTRTGELLVICAMPSDTIQWVVDQLDPAGDVAGVALAVAEELLWFTYIGMGDDMLRGASLAELGLGLDSTLGDFMRARAADSAVPRVVVAA